MPTTPVANRHRIRIARVAGAVVLAGTGLVMPITASSLPLFSRSMQAPCSRCHLAVPVLNAYGTRFLAAGDRAPGRAIPALATAHTQPFSVVLEAGEALARHDTLSSRGARDARSSGGFRHDVLDAHAAGGAGRHLSYHVQASLDSAARAVGTTTAFVQFDDLAGDGALAVKAGHFDAGLPFLSSARRPTLRDYLAPVEVDARGVEVNGVHAAWGYAVGVMNNSRTGTGAGGHGFKRLQDTYLRLTRELGGQALGGRLLFDRQDSDITYHAWLQRLQAQLGGRFGADRIWFVPAYTLDRFDDRPAAGIHQRHQYVMLEALALLGGDRNWTLAARGEHEHTTPTLLTPGDDHDLEALRLARVVTPNARLALEWSRVAVTAAGPRESRVDATVQLAY